MASKSSRRPPKTLRGIRQVEGLQVSFEWPGEGAHPSSDESPRRRLVTRGVLALSAAAAIVVADAQWSVRPPGGRPGRLDHGEPTSQPDRIIRKR
jgi:hypothetical protein